MLDLAAAIDNSFLHTQAAPGFVAVGVAHSAVDGEAEFVRNMECRLKEHKKQLDAWMAEGVSRLKILARHVENAPFGLDADEVARLLRLSDAIRDSAERSAASYASMVKQLKKQGRSFAKYSISASDFVVSLALRVETCLGDELEFLMDASDNYRALARRYGPNQKKSEVFSDPEVALAYLKSACLREADHYGRIQGGVQRAGQG